MRRKRQRLTEKGLFAPSLVAGFGLVQNFLEEKFWNKCTHCFGGCYRAPVDLVLYVCMCVVRARTVCCETAVLQFSMDTPVADVSRNMSVEIIELNL